MFMIFRELCAIMVDQALESLHISTTLPRVTRPSVKVSSVRCLSLTRCIALHGSVSNEARHEKRR